MIKLSCSDQKGTLRAPLAQDSSSLRTKAQWLGKEVVMIPHQMETAVESGQMCRTGWLLVLVMVTGL